MKVVSSELSISKLSISIGKPANRGLSGSTVYFIKNFQANSADSDETLENYKGIFQLFSQGLLLRLFKDDKRKFIPIPNNIIVRVVISKGTEDVSPILLSPFWLLLKCRVPLEIARYFRISISEYKITETLVKIITSKGSIMLETNGYLFGGQVRFFKKAISEKLSIIHF